MNEYDSSRMVDLLRESHGASVVDNPRDADLLLLNTCSIREKAAEKVFSELGRWRSLKRANPNLIIGVGGCVASQEGEAITARAPQVDIVFGPQTLHRLPEMLDEARSDRVRVIDVSFPEIEKFDRLPTPRAEGPSAFVSVMEGCSKYCTFCVVPYTRGPEVSRPVAGVMREVVGLAGRGVREINFLGQNVNAYRGVIDEGEADLAELIHYAARIDGIDRIRFTTSHPVEFTPSLIDAYADVPELASHMHLPVQSGSDRVLAMMKRGHTVLEYKAKIRALRRARPNVSLSSDFIVGFPGETERDFEATLRLVRELDYDISFSFIYSARPRHAGGDAAGRHALAGEEASPRALAGATAAPSRRSRPGDGGHVAARAGHRSVQTWRRARRAHGKQPRGQLCGTGVRQARSRRRLCDGGDPRGAAEFTARAHCLTCRPRGHVMLPSLGTQQYPI